MGGGSLRVNSRAGNYFSSISICVTQGKVFNFLSFNFLICMMGIIVESTLLNCYDNSPPPPPLTFHYLSCSLL